MAGLLSFCILVPLKTAAVVCAILLSRAAWRFVHMVFIYPLSDPLRLLPGPDATRFQNHFRQLMDPKYSIDTHENWAATYGKTFRFHGFGKHDYRLLSFDFRVISHVLNSSMYEKPWQTRAFLTRLIGRGIFSMEGEEHRKQRRLLGPAFSSQTVKRVAPIFFQKANELCDCWRSLIQAARSKDQRDRSTCPEATTFSIDIAHWASRAAFDVIGLAGFDYRFHALKDESEEVYLAYRRMFSVTDKGPGVRGLLELYFPILRHIFPRKDVRVTDESLRAINRAGSRLIARKKNEALQSQKDETGRKDILNLLIKANLSTDESKRLSDAELLDQCSTFLHAGSDSVALAISWCLHLLSKNLKIQTRLREELLCGSLKDLSEELTLEKLENYWGMIDALPYLDAVVRETLRLCPPVHGTIRVAIEDDRIPVSEPITLRDGTVIPKGGHITIRKGSYVHIPIEGLNYSSDIWGPTAQEFDPDRWSSLPKNAQSPLHPGLGNLMTFGFGPHSCLGYKFTLAEIKIFLAILIPCFVFTPDPDIQIAKFNAILTRPYVIDQWDLGTRLPTLVQEYRHR